MESLMMVMMGAEGVQIKRRGGVVYQHLQPPSGSEQAPTTHRSLRFLGSFNLQLSTQRHVYQICIAIYVYTQHDISALYQAILYTLMLEFDPSSPSSTSPHPND
jgi:hypothetical protein